MDKAMRDNGSIPLSADSGWTTPSIENLLAEHALHSRERDLRTKRIRLWLLATLGPLLGIIVGIAVATRHWGVLATCACLATFAATASVSRGQRATTELLAQTDDVRAIGALVDAYDFGDEELWPIAESALIGLLPKLTQEEAHLLGARHHNTLRRALQADAPNRMLVIAVLTAFLQLGDLRDLRAVRRLIAGGTWDSDPEVSALLETCRMHLSAVAAEHRKHATLLRPAGLMDDGSTLMRAAHNHSERDALYLLRAATNIGQLSVGCDDELIVSILHDLEWTGGESARPYILRILATPGAPQEVRDAARSCLAALDTRARAVSIQNRV